MRREWVLVGYPCRRGVERLIRAYSCLLTLPIMGFGSTNVDKRGWLFKRLLMH